jgi:hypothetical protein
MQNILTILNKFTLVQKKYPTIIEREQILNVFKIIQADTDFCDTEIKLLSYMIYNYKFR